VAGEDPHVDPREGRGGAKRPAAQSQLLVCNDLRRWAGNVPAAGWANFPRFLPFARGLSPFLAFAGLSSRLAAGRATVWDRPFDPTHCVSLSGPAFGLPIREARWPHRNHPREACSLRKLETLGRGPQMFRTSVRTLPNRIGAAARSTMSFLRRRPVTVRFSEARSDTSVAASALLLELAHADREFTDEERRYVEATVRGQFGLGRAESEKLLAIAEKERHAHSGILHFTNPLVEGYSTGQRTLLCDLMRRLMHVDGEVTREEDYLLRKTCSLLRSKPTPA
jgi:uncharacterized tellurite resistance protein B-like protein